MLMQKQKIQLLHYCSDMSNCWRTTEATEGKIGEPVFFRPKTFYWQWKSSQQQNAVDQYTIWALAGEVIAEVKPKSDTSCHPKYSSNRHTRLYMYTSTFKLHIANAFV